jgi:DnaJ-domain-containing protein 1
VEKNNINPVLLGRNAGAPFSFYPLHPDDKFENDYQQEMDNKSNKRSNKIIPDTISQLLKYFDVKYPNADLNLLKHNYRSKLAEYHPDKVQHLGDDIKKLSEQKTKEIIENYNRLLRWLENDENR